MQSHEYHILSNYQRHNYTYLPRETTLQKQPPINHTTRDTIVLTCLQQHSYNNNLMSAILPETQIYLPAYSNHLTITTTCLPYYQKHNCTYLPTATTLQYHPHTCHTARDTNILSCLQQPPYNNNHLSPYYQTQLYLPAYSNHLTITTTYLPYYQRHIYSYLPTATT